MFKQAGKVKFTALMLALSLGGVGVASATTFAGGLVGGKNTLLDESRETYVDANGDGRFSVGDVIFGYIRISDFQPGGAAANNQVYGIFSQQVAAGSAGRNVIFQPTTVAGLTLFDLTGSNANVGANAIAAFYDKTPAFTDLINNVSPVGNTSMTDYLAHIQTGTLRIVAGLDGVDDFLFSEISIQAAVAGMSIGGFNAAFTDPVANNNFTVASNFGAFSMLYNNTGFAFNAQSIFNPLTAAFSSAEIGITQGTTGGAVGGGILPSPKGWLEAGGAFAQCLTPVGDVACGFTDKNNFTVDVQVPEPATLALLSVSLLGLGFAGRRRRQG